MIFERGANPISRSFKLTHASFGPTLGRVLLLAIAVIVFEWVVGLIIGAIQRAIVINALNDANISLPDRVGLGLVEAAGTIITAPVATALLVTGLMPLYGGLRARETATSTPILRQQLTR